MNILAIDTANSFLSLALQYDGICYTLCENIGNKQSEFILPKIDKLLSEHNVQLKQLHGISYNSGAGGFTGLRIGLSVALALAYSLNIPLYPVTMFAMYNEKLQQTTNSIIVLDARLGQVYIAGFDAKSQYLIQPQLINPEQLKDILKQHELLSQDTIVTGDGWSNYAIINQDSDLAQLNVVVSEYPAADTMINLINSGVIESCSPAQADLLYLRNKVALNLAEQKLAKQV